MFPHFQYPRSSPSPPERSIKLSYHGIAFTVWTSPGPGFSWLASQAHSGRWGHPGMRWQYHDLAGHKTTALKAKFCNFIVYPRGCGVQSNDHNIKLFVTIWLSPEPGMVMAISGKEELRVGGGKWRWPRWLKGETNTHGFSKCDRGLLFCRYKTLCLFSRAL